MSQNTHSPNDISQIRDLIFGENIREYDRKFVEVEKELAKLHTTLNDQSKRIQDLQDKIKTANELIEANAAKSEQTFLKKIDELDRELSQKLERLAEDKTDRLKIGNYLIEMGMRLKDENVMQQLLDENSNGNEG